MNKKLLLSFAVFATAFGVNAQKRQALPIKTEAAVSKEVSVNVSEAGDVTFSEFKRSAKSKKTRGSKQITDTLRLVALRKLFGNPDHAFLTQRAIKSKVYKTANANYYVGVAQTFKSPIQTTLKGVGVKLTSWNAKDVDLHVLYKSAATKNDTVATITLNVPQYTNANGTVHFFNFPNPLAVLDTFSIDIAPTDPTDSLNVFTTGAYSYHPKALGSISGTTLTIDQTQINAEYYKGWAMDGNGWMRGGFYNGLEITGANILPGTKIVKQTGQFTYTVNNSQTVAVDTIHAETMGFNSYDGYQNVYVEPTSGTPSFVQAALWTDDNNDPLESDVYMYPLVDYKVESTPSLVNKCLGDSKTVTVQLDQKVYDGVIRNPLFNKDAFYMNYLGYNRTNFYYFADLHSPLMFNDTLDASTGNVQFTYTYSDDTQNDSLYLAEWINAYGYKVAGGYKAILSGLLVSSKLASFATVSEAVKCNGGDAKVIVASTVGGFTPYTGEGEQTGVKAGARSFDVTDANGCKTAATITVTEPAAVEATATVTEAIKCNGGVAKVTVAGTVGVSPFTGEGVQNDVVAGAHSYTVTDNNGCVGTASVTVSEPAKLVVTTASAVAHAGKSDGKAVVIAAGGTAPYTYEWSNSLGTNDTVLVAVGTSYQATVTDANNCTATSDKIVVALSSVSELAINGLAIYPNPVAAELHVAFNANSAATVELVNVAGQVIDTKTTTSVANTVFNTSSLEAGVYFVNIKVAEGTFTQKVIKD